MKLDQETLEVLMGKHLDGEISSAEARLLQTHLEQDAEARQVLDQLQDLHRSSQEAVTQKVLGRGRSAQDIIAAALQQSQGHRPLRLIKRVVFSQFSAGLAAGLLIAGACLLLFNLLSNPSAGQGPRTRIVEPETRDDIVPQAGPGPQYADWTEPNPGIERTLDWFVFPDKQGRYYLIEGLREDRRVTPAVYRGDF